MPPHPLTNFEIQKYYQNEPKLNGVYSRNNLPKIKDGAYVINLDDYKSLGTHWIALYVNGNNRRASYNAIYFDSLLKYFQQLKRWENYIALFAVSTENLKNLKYHIS